MSNYFKRVEKKYLLDKEVSKNIKTITEDVISNKNVKDKYKYTDIRTIYFDNNDYLIYHIKKNKNEVRYKIRLREYSRNGNSGRYIWVELKEKVCGVSYKHRFRIKKKHINSFIAGKNVMWKVFKANLKQKRPQLGFLYNKIQGTIIDHNLKPKFAVEYVRVAFEKGLDDKLRLTFDSNLKCYEVNDYNIFNKPKSIFYFDTNVNIMEIKSCTELPLWLKELKRENGIKKQKFSKFVFGSESLFQIDNVPPQEVFNEYKAMREELHAFNKETKAVVI